MSRYPLVYDGDYVYPRMRGYKMMCCDCGLVHNIDFDVRHVGRGHQIRFRVRRNVRSTASARRRTQLREAGA